MKKHSLFSQSKSFPFALSALAPAIAFSVQPYYNVTGKHHRGVRLSVDGKF